MNNDILFFFYNYKKKAIGVVNRAAFRCMRGNSLATHGLGPHACYRIYDRPLTNLEQPFFAGLKRAVVYFYDSIDRLIEEEEKAGATATQIEELRTACEKLEFRKHHPELSFIE